MDSPFSRDFRIGSDRHDKIIAALYPSVSYNPVPSESLFIKDLECGIIRISYGDKSEDEIIYYDSGNNSLLFTINGHRYMRGGRGNLNLRKEHFEIYGRASEHISESNALTALLEESSDYEIVGRMNSWLGLDFK